MRPGLSPAAAAIAARLAFAGNCAAPWRAAAAVCKPGVVTITWLAPRGEGRGVEVVCVVLVSLALEASEVEAEAEGEGLKEGDVTAEEAGGAVEITVAVLLLDVESVVPVRERLVTAALVKGRTGLTVRVVAVLLVTRLGVVATNEAGLGKIALIGELLVPPLLGGLILFSFWRRLQNQTRVTSFSILSCSAIKVMSSEVGF